LLFSKTKKHVCATVFVAFGLFTIVCYGCLPQDIFQYIAEI